MKIAVCEDNLETQFQLEKYLEKFKTSCSWEIFSSGEELLSYLDREGAYFSLYFMDISLPGKNGIEICAKIREKDTRALLVFVTDYKEYVYQVFEVLPFRFLTKPVSPQAFTRVLHDAFRHLGAQSRPLSFKIQQTVYEIPQGEILYLEGELRKIHVHTLNREYVFYGRLEQIKAGLDQRFFVQTHKSYLVNLEYAEAVKENRLILRNQQLIPISRKWKEQVKLRHLEYLKWRWGEC
ncbi:MAG TPA: LytTR family DNA-binding domain-containing protein [Candidatus Blautia pullicola]|uniref:Stage 0 sporulation protein A homolog n=1 Tax=Candidatus Blautia pullicola TaxID=2838498 RepID=A0A9D2JT17_9FIRM|nr:LytTR family DNA-binding domain-containing protein [Candidatus Blautia pullicola]